MLTDGCLCGAVRYAIDSAPLYTFICYCRDCVRISAGARLAGFTAPADKTKITGATQSYTIRADSGALTHRYFCGVCGAYLYGAPDLVDGMINFSIGSLDDPNQAAPSLAVYTRSRASWDVTSESVTCFAELPPDAPA